ncbi:MAG: tRNA (adenosine(37)-N6)-threonylcarbamoyltransferase complex transferase subunit TsaD [Flavobacteriales bacterium]|nr:tRNA (adenosine(37)-N6)-threonylcarbamoyltransferase complex transferase subunit TsaD [Flavobacteriales bacterium]MCB9168037.1 tRNA (adenosine(37)-N6)-threonylcarbamoyltransferase complex transferase subunit TsaD [Flavobacteriales bacterium]
MAKLAADLERGSTPEVVLGIESSCDDTAAAVLVDGHVRANVVAGQEVHRRWGGVVPELASRAHQENLVPVVHEAMRLANIGPSDLTAVAFTQGPGLIGALLVGACFARSLAQALSVPLIAVDHLQAHVLAHFIPGQGKSPELPFLNLTVSGGHTRLVLVRSALDMQVIGTTRDDAAGEAFDKGAKLLGLDYPGGPLIDRWAREGDPKRYALPTPRMDGLDMSFSGVKTAFRDLVQSVSGGDPERLNEERAHLAATLQNTIVKILVERTKEAVERTGCTRVGVSGGVSVNSALRSEMLRAADTGEWSVHFPRPEYCTDNAAMIATAGRFLLHAGIVAPLDVVPHARPPKV